MKKNLILATLCSIVIFGFSGSAFAVEGEPIAGVDVNLGSNGGLMVSADLGIDSVGTLPTSPFYFLKEWKRGITRLFTFDSIAKAELELNITNQIAAELLEVSNGELMRVSSGQDTDSNNGLDRAIQNYTEAQARLNYRITTINGTSNIADTEKLLEDVDKKTAKHLALLQAIAERWESDPYAEDSARKGSIGDPDFDLLTKRLEDAQDNILKTFTITVTPINDAPSLKQKAEEQIELAGVAIGEVPAGTIVLVVRGMVLPPPTEDESNIFDRWGNMIAKAKGNLESAKKAFAEGKYGEAYGLARSAEAVASAVRVAVGDINGDGRADQTAPASPTSTTKENVKTGENESPRPTDKAKVVPTATTTPEKEKSETSQPAGGSVGPASNYDR